MRISKGPAPIFQKDYPEMGIGLLAQSGITHVKSYSKGVYSECYVRVTLESVCRIIGLLARLFYHIFFIQLAQDLFIFFVC